MIRPILLSMAVLAIVVFAGSSTAEARGCYRSSGAYGGGYAPTYRSARYYGGGPSYYRGPSVYRRSYYGGGHPAAHGIYHGGHHGYHRGYRSGVSLSFGF